MVVDGNRVQVGFGIVLRLSNRFAWAARRRSSFSQSKYIIRKFFYCSSCKFSFDDILYFGSW
jgi:hypothetical protein